MVTALVGAIVLSALAGYVLVRYSRVHIRFSADEVGGGPQKFHFAATPRVGGIAIFAGLVLGLFLLERDGHLTNREVGSLILSVLPVFAIGLGEDVTKRISPHFRLAASLFAAALAFWLLNAELRRLDIPFVDTLLQLTPLALFVSTVCLAGLVHAMNIIDGYNGLAAGVAVIVLLALGYVAFRINDHFLVLLCAVSLASVLGFLICNYPSGSIFAGDCGAYLIGFLIGVISVLLVTRNPEVSAWCPLLLMVYPVWETLFSIYRKKFVRGHSPGEPDGVHLHMLIYKRLVRFGEGKPLPADWIRRNSQTSPYCWVLTALSALPAVLFWRNTLLLAAFNLIFILGYCRLYWSIVTFKSPKSLRRKIKVAPSHFESQAKATGGG